MLKYTKRLRNELLDHVVDAAQYGQAILADGSKCPLALISKSVFDIDTKPIDKTRVLTRWFRYLDRVFLSIYWPDEKKGLIFPFNGKQKTFIRSIIRKRSFAIGNSIGEKRLLVVDVLKDEPMEWMKKRLF